MALHDRAYMKTTSRHSAGGWRSMALRIALVQAAGVFLHEAARGWFGFRLDDWTVLKWAHVRTGSVWTVVTYPFAGFFAWSWLFDALAVYVIGTIAEVWLGRTRFVVFAVLATLAGAIVHLVAFATGIGNVAGIDVAYGLSTVATAIVVFAALREPSYPVNVFPFVVRLWVLALVWIALDVSAALGFTHGGANLWAHVGAAAYGAAAWRWDLVPAVPLRRRAPVAEVCRDSEEAETRARVDRLLEKISREGIGSLSDSERAFLTAASKRYR